MRYIFICFLFLFSCSQSDDNLSIFKYNEVSGISTLDPVYSKDQATTWVANQLFNGLVQLDSNLCVIPCIAKGWDISDDALEYTFLLRDDVYFHYHETFDNPRKVIGSAPLATANLLISAILLVNMRPIAFSPTFIDSAMPHTIAYIFFNAHANSTPSIS